MRRKGVYDTSVHAAPHPQKKTHPWKWFSKANPFKYSKDKKMIRLQHADGSFSWVPNRELETEAEAVA